MYIYFLKHSLKRLLWLNLYWNYGRSFVNFKDRVMFEKQYYLKKMRIDMFLKNTQYNVKYFDLYNWWISQKSNNIPTRYRQMNSGGVGN